MKIDGTTNARQTLMLLLADAEGAGAEDEDELEDWALTKIGRSTAVSASENFMIVLPRNREECFGMVQHGGAISFFLS